MKRLIIEGDFKGKHPSRSEAHFEAITLMLAEEWPPEKIGAVLLNPEYKIGEKIRERGSGRAEEFAAREVAKAKATFDPSQVNQTGASIYSNWLMVVQHWIQIQRQ